MPSRPSWKPDGGRCRHEHEVLVAGERHWQTLGEVVAAQRHASGNLFFDIRTVALMREHGVREIYTADADFKLFSGIKVLNPIRD